MFGTICDEAVVMAKCTCTACKSCICPCPSSNILDLDEFDEYSRCRLEEM